MLVRGECPNRLKRGDDLVVGGKVVETCSVSFSEVRGEADVEHRAHPRLPLFNEGSRTKHKQSAYLSAC